MSCSMSPSSSSMGMSLSQSASRAGLGGADEGAGDAAGYILAPELFADLARLTAAELGQGAVRAAVEHALHIADALPVSYEV